MADLARALDRPTQYATDVVDGRVVASRLVRLACQRHMDDRTQRTGPDGDLVWNADEAQAAIDFFEQVLCLPEDTTRDDGEAPPLDGSPFLLRPWQAFIVGALFGWYTSGGTRRFRTAYVETGKGSGKTPLAAGIALYLLIADGERGAQVFAAAVTREQAKLAFTDAERMVQASPALREILDQKVNNLAVLETGSFFRPISSEKRGLDGKRVHGAIIDELHEHASDIVVNKMRAGTKGRRSALIFEITNSGYDRHSVCWQHHEYSRSVLEGTQDNDTWFAFVCHLDDGDDWQTEGPHWLKANPNLGVSLPWQYLRDQVREAIGMPGKQNIVRRLNFCEWTEQAERWIEPVAWDASAGELRVPPRMLEALLEGRACYGGLDLSTTTDLSALVLLFLADDGVVDVLPYFWLPEDNLKRRVEKDRVPYDVWAREGLLLLTPGNVIDYEKIRDHVLLCQERFDLRELGYDPWNGQTLISWLEAAGVICFKVPQRVTTLTNPTKELEKRMLERRFRHHGHPILRWNALNAATESDAAGNIMLSKRRSMERIDGLAASVNALDCLTRNAGDDSGGDWWERGHGVATL
jgi:phage terminase large subunit-like protein